MDSKKETEKVGRVMKSAGVQRHIAVVRETHYGISGGGVVRMIRNSFLSNF